MMFDSNTMFSTWIVVLFVLIIIAIIVANDANRRGHNGVLWALVVIFMPMMGVFFYLIFISVNPKFDATLNKPQTTPRYTQSGPVYTQTYQAPTQEQVDGEYNKFCVSCGRGNIEKAEYCVACGSKIPKVN